MGKKSQNIGTHPQGGEVPEQQFELLFVLSISGIYFQNLDRNVVLSALMIFKVLISNIQGRIHKTEL